MTTKMTEQNSNSLFFSSVKYAGFKPGFVASAIGSLHAAYQSASSAEKKGLNISIEQHPFKQMEWGHKISLSTLLNVQRHLNESTHPLLPVDIWMSHISISHRILWASTIVHLNEPPNLLSHPTNLRRATKSYKPLQLNEPPNLIILYNSMSHKIL